MFMMMIILFKWQFSFTDVFTPHSQLLLSLSLGENQQLNLVHVMILKGSCPVEAVSRKDDEIVEKEKSRLQHAGVCPLLSQPLAFCCWTQFHRPSTLDKATLWPWQTRVLCNRVWTQTRHGHWANHRWPNFPSLCWLIWLATTFLQVTS